MAGEVDLTQIADQAPDDPILQEEDKKFFLRQQGWRAAEAAEANRQAAALAEGGRMAGQFVMDVPATILNAPYTIARQIGVAPQEQYQPPFEAGKSIVPVPEWLKREIEYLGRDISGMSGQTALGPQFKIPEEIPTGIGKAGAEFASGLTTPEMIPFLLSGTGAAGMIRPEIQRAAAATFAAQMGLGVPEEASRLGADWDKLSLEEKSRRSAALGLQAGLVAGIGVHPEIAARREAEGTIIPVEQQMMRERFQTQAEAPGRVAEIDQLLPVLREWGTPEALAQEEALLHERQRLVGWLPEPERTAAREPKVTPLRTAAARIAETQPIEPYATSIRQRESTTIPLEVPSESRPPVGERISTPGETPQTRPVVAPEIPPAPAEAKPAEVIPARPAEAPALAASAPALSHDLVLVNHKSVDLPELPLEKMKRGALNPHTGEVNPGRIVWNPIGAAREFISIRGKTRYTSYKIPRALLPEGSWKITREGLEVNKQAVLDFLNDPIKRFENRNTSRNAEYFTTEDIEAMRLGTAPTTRAPAGTTIATTPIRLDRPVGATGTVGGLIPGARRRPILNVTRRAYEDLKAKHPLLMQIFTEKRPEELDDAFWNGIRDAIARMPDYAGDPRTADALTENLRRLKESDYDFQAALSNRHPAILKAYQEFVAQTRLFEDETRAAGQDVYSSVQPFLRNWENHVKDWINEPEEHLQEILGEINHATARIEERRQQMADAGLTKLRETQGAYTPEERARGIPAIQGEPIIQFERPQWTTTRGARRYENWLIRHKGLTEDEAQRKAEQIYGTFREPPQIGEMRWLIAIDGDFEAFIGDELRQGRQPPLNDQPASLSVARHLLQQPIPGLPEENRAVLRDILNSPVAGYLNGRNIRLRITDAMRGMSGFYDPLTEVISIARTARPEIGAHEFFHPLWEMLRDEDHDSLTRWRADAIRAELQKPGADQALLNRLLAGELSSREWIEQGLGKKYYYLRSAEEYFAETMSDRFIRDRKGIWGQAQEILASQDAFLSRIRQILQVIFDAIRQRVPGLRTQADILQRTILDGRYEVVPPEISGNIPGKRLVAKNAVITAPGVGPEAIITAYHGSPYAGIRQFSLAKIGTGEGAQVYGWGIYAAEHPEVAKTYWGDASAIREERFAILDENNELVDRFSTRQQAEQAIAINEQIRLQHYPDRPKANWRVVEQQPGSLYTVRLDLNHEDLLDWDLPLNEQSNKVQTQLLRDQGVQEILRNYITDGGKITSGQDVYHALSQAAGPELASAALRELGIPGIKYLDQGSRPGAWPVSHGELEIAPHYPGPTLQPGER